MTILHEHERPRRRRARRAVAATVAAAGILLVLLAGYSWASFGAWSATASSVASVAPGGRTVTAILPFRYRARTRFLEVPISADELAAAERLRTDTVFAQPSPVRDAYLRTLVRTQSTSHVVGEVARQLRAMRTSLRLDRDEYVELMTAAVQAITYGTPRSAFELPVRSLAAGRGVCVDRSVLLAALLVHEGYDAGLWTLASCDHVAVAIRGRGAGYRGSGYVYVETTRRAYVGEVPDAYVAIPSWQPAPRLVVFGRGMPYGADVETTLLVEERRRAEDVARDLRSYARYASEAAGRWRVTYSAEARRQAEAATLAVQLRACVDDRKLAFRTLERLSGWAEPGQL